LAGFEPRYKSVVPHAQYSNGCSSLSLARKWDNDLHFISQRIISTELTKSLKSYTAAVANKTQPLADNEMN